LIFIVFTWIILTLTLVFSDVGISKDETKSSFTPVVPELPVTPAGGTRPLLRNSGTGEWRLFHLGSWVVFYPNFGFFSLSTSCRLGTDSERPSGREL
jgi:4-amino-4-deoxy-L-arabinose transferase-like glycosyltransferase